VSTVPEVIIEDVISPSILSVAVAPGSVKVLSNLILIVDEPTNEIVGGIMSIKPNEAVITWSELTSMVRELVDVPSDHPEKK
jgi:hypothetical protein